MLPLSSIRDWIASLNIVPDDHVYSGKLDAKKKQSIGVYNRKQEGMPPRTTLGGIDTKKYDIKRISLLVHGDEYQRKTEALAFRLWKAIEQAKDVTINNRSIYIIQFVVPEPVDVSTDDNGIYEFVIWVDFYYQEGD